MAVLRNGILAGGNFIVDHVKSIEEWPEQATLADISSSTRCGGGGPYNVLRDLSRLDPSLPRFACGLLGDDDAGNWILNDCQKLGINTQRISQTDKLPTSYTDVMSVASSGQRTFFHERGTNSLLNEAHFQFQNCNAKIFLLGYLMLLDSLDEFKSGTTGAATVIRRAKAEGLITAADCVSLPHERFSEIALASLSVTDIFFLNEFEAQQILGEEVGSQRDDLVRAATGLYSESNNDDVTVVLHSSSGAVAVNQNGCFVQPSFSMPQELIQGSNGAGDAFAAGVLLGIHREQNWQQCLLYGAAVAAKSLTDPTPSGGLGTLQECLEFANQFDGQDF